MSGCENGNKVINDSVPYAAAAAAAAAAGASFSGTRNMGANSIADTDTVSKALTF